MNQRTKIILHQMMHTTLSRSRKKLKSLARFESYPVEVRIVVPQGPLFGDWLRISSKERTAKLRFDHHNRVWKLRISRKILSDIDPSPKHTETYAVLLRQRWRLLQQQYVTIIEKQRDEQAAVIAFDIRCEDIFNVA